MPGKCDEKKKLYFLQLSEVNKSSMLKENSLDFNKEKNMSLFFSKQEYIILKPRLFLILTYKSKRFSNIFKRQPIYTHNPVEYLPIAAYFLLGSWALF